MNDFLRENLSYFSLYKKMFAAKKTITPEYVSFGKNKEQYFLYYEPENICSNKIVLWIHGGGWNAGSPEFFDFTGQAIAAMGYRFISLGYRLSPKFKYPCQIEDVVLGYKSAVKMLEEKGIDTSKIVVSGPSAGAHLASILVYSASLHEKTNLNLDGVIGFIGVGGPYSFTAKTSLSLKLLLNQLFPKNYNRTLGEPCSLIEKSSIPMLLIQSEHDGLIDFSCAERFYAEAQKSGISCELYRVEDRKNTHSWYTAGMFLETREENKTLDKFISWIENL